ncbi:hypothetical protein [Parabacteroides timonensis]|uniref:hypothetical protein n=1 Tax=Parabacteroides timonensis TaxID=1871013 RepID=UPI00094E2C4D|nr:hypothetical protein [Parabacteroides timonensis]
MKRAVSISASDKEIKIKVIDKARKELIRIQTENYPEELNKLVEETEKASASTCEKCGAPGSLRKCVGVV